ncbi:MAG: ABC transporter permease [Deltaproteobacteria bacterium]|nr:ABC transporter permease [Deltaproteobacteria bacterium]
MSGSSLAAMAWRNVWRNKRRTLVTLSGIAFGVLLTVFFTSISDDSYGKMIEMAARLGGGHLTFQHPDLLENPSLKNTVENADELAALALEDDDVEKVVTRITGSTLLAAGGNSYGAGFLAIDPAVEDESTLSILEAIKEGELFDSSTGRGIVVGQKLADNLGIGIGKKVACFPSTRSGRFSATGRTRPRRWARSSATSARARRWPRACRRGRQGTRWSCPGPRRSPSWPTTSPWTPRSR